ncbi:hypothetical protein L7F22_011987 [Adiantum nelumboides]|nr:hypothetical protein [Adiantum nelumboides]
MQAVMTFITVEEHGAKRMGMVQNAQTTAAESCKVAEKLGMGSSSTSGELHNMMLQQRLKKLLLQLPRSRKGYHLSFIQRKIMEDVAIFLDVKQLEALVSLMSDNFRLQKQKNGSFLLFWKRQIHVPATEQTTQKDPVNSKTCRQSEKKEGSISEAVEGELSSCKDGQAHDSTMSRQTDCISEVPHVFSCYHVVLNTVFAGVLWLVREISKRL